MAEVSSPDLQPKIAYRPTPKETQMVRFRKFAEKKYSVQLNDYWGLHEWSYKNFPEFWECIWQFFGIIHSQPYTEVFDRKRSFTNMEWFPGARLNYAENVFRYRDSHTAIIAIDDYDNAEYVTYQDMYREVCVYAAALKASGIQKGEIVACYMSNKKEAVFAFFATAAIGAMWLGSLPLLGTKAVLARFNEIKPKILFTAGNFTFEDKHIRMDQKLPQIAAGAKSIEKIIFVPSKVAGVIENIEEIPKCCSINDFLNPWREKYENNPWELQFEQVPFDYPLCISFSSGTSGQPKNLIHSVGVLVTPFREFALHQDCGREDVMFTFSPVGWISWHMSVNTLLLGLTLCLYEGDVFGKSPTRFWDMIDKFGVTTGYIWSSTLESMELKGHGPTPSHSLKTLRQLFPIGSPTKPHSYDYLAQKIKPGLFFGSIYGNTEFFGLLSGVDCNLPVYRGELQCFSLGIDFRCIDEKGNYVVGKRGNLVVANPYPTMPITLFKDEDKQKLWKTYLQQYPGHWYLADDAWVNPTTKGFIIYGRSDETMNPKGARFNCAEIYFALDGFPGIMDSVCVSQYNENMDERVILFVKMAAGNALTDEIKRKISRIIEDSLTFEHVPDIIMEVPDIPYNLTGKKLNGVVKRLINKQPILNAEIVINQNSLEFYKNLELGEF